VGKEDRLRKIDDVRIYNRALSAAEVAQLYTLGTANVAHSASGPNAPLSNGLVGYWTLDGSATNWRTNTTADLSGNSNTGTLVSMSTSTSPIAGKIGQALQFGTSPSGFEVAVNPSTLQPSTVTVSTWAKPTFSSQLLVPSANAGFEAIISAGSFQLGINGFFCEFDGGDLATMPYNKWFHIVYSYDGSIIRVYVNGVPYGSYDCPGHPAIDYTGEVPLHFGPKWW